MKSGTYDLVIIGGGGAAVLAAVHAADAGMSVALVTKDYPGFGNTRLAVGMAACPGLTADDSEELFYKDLLRSGVGINEPAVVRAFAREAADGVAELEKLGPLFPRSSEGTISPEMLTLVGGHSTARSMPNLGGGAALGTTLRSSLWRYGISLYSSSAVLELVKNEEKIIGVLALDLKRRKFFGLECRAAVVATGGCAALYYPHTTNSRGAVGDGLALALRAGAVLWDMEQVQAIPFGLTRPRSMIGALCGEPSTAGPAGRLVDGSGKALLDGGINKMTRADVTRVMMAAITAGKTDPDGGLLLDLSPNLKLGDGKKIYRSIRDSGIFDIVRKAYGLRAYRWEEPWSVMPTFHYLMGGIRAGITGETGVNGLLATGEVQAGLHGGNRLGSTALSEIFTSGARLGKFLGRQKACSGRATGTGTEAESLMQKLAVPWKEILSGNGSNNPALLRVGLEDCMWRLAGPVKSEPELLRALSEIERLSDESKKLAINRERSFNRQILDAVELNLMLPVAKALVLSALERRESRGSHLRSDHLFRDDKQFRCHTYIRLKENGSMNSGLERLES